MGSFYPIIVTSKFEETINFYEDFLGFHVEMETDDFAYLKNKGDDCAQLGVSRLNSEISVALPQVEVFKGMVIKISVPDINYAYERLYMEGVQIIKEITNAKTGRPYFIISDVNGTWVTFGEEKNMQSSIWAGESKTASHVFEGV